MKKCNDSDFASIYKDYNEVIKPLIASIEAKEERLPVPILNEIRAVNDHIARCYSDGATDDFKAEQIRKAQSHIERIVLDCLKILNMLVKKRMEGIESRTRLEQIDSGRFYVKYSQLADEAEKLATQAKLTESADKIKAISLFQQSAIVYKQIEDLIADNRTHIIWAKILFWQKPFVAFFIWFGSILLSAALGVVFGRCF